MNDPSYWRQLGAASEREARDADLGGDYTQMVWSRNHAACHNAEAEVAAGNDIAYTVFDSYYPPLERSNH